MCYIYSGMITPVVRDNRIVAFFWCAFQMADDMDWLAIPDPDSIEAIAEASVATICFRSSQPSGESRTSAYSG